MPAPCPARRRSFNYCTACSTPGTHRCGGEIQCTRGDGAPSLTIHLCGGKRNAPAEAGRLLLLSHLNGGGHSAAVLGRSTPLLSRLSGGQLQRASGADSLHFLLSHLCGGQHCALKSRSAASRNRHFADNPAGGENVGARNHPVSEVQPFPALLRFTKHPRERGEFGGETTMPMKIRCFQHHPGTEASPKAGNEPDVLVRPC